MDLRLMDLRAIAIIAIAAALLAGAIVFLPSQGIANEIFLEVGSENIASGEELAIKAIAPNADRISLLFGKEYREIPCTASLDASLDASAENCTLSASFFPMPGVYVAKATGFFGEEQRQAERRIIVTRSEMQCVNNVAFGECSENKPFYCEFGTGKLIENCGMCGCEEGLKCLGNICIAVPGELSIARLGHPEKALAGKEFFVKIIAKAKEAIKEGAQYNAKIFVAGKQFSQKFFAPQLEIGEEHEFLLAITIFETGLFDINATITPVDNNSFAAEFFESQSIESVLAAQKPAAPVLFAFAEGDDAVLEWSKPQGASGFRVYKSSQANAAYIAYTFHSEYFGGEAGAVIQGLEKGKHYFVVTAVGELGAESDYSEPKSVEVG
ncbi:MAG: hypothetical protein NUV67_00685 [archaeon]|nr:hypothetical protein [archaeon]